VAAGEEGSRGWGIKIGDDVGDHMTGWMREKGVESKEKDDHIQGFYLDKFFGRNDLPKWLKTKNNSKKFHFFSWQLWSLFTSIIFLFQTEEKIFGTRMIFFWGKRIRQSFLFLKNAFRSKITRPKRWTFLRLNRGRGKKI